MHRADTRRAKCHTRCSKLLVAAAIVAGIVRYIRIPYTVALVLVGLGSGAVAEYASGSLTPGIILTVFLPVLLFYGAYNLDVRDVRANLTPDMLLALPGVVVTAGLVGAAMHWLAVSPGRMACCLAPLLRQPIQ